MKSICCGLILALISSVTCQASESHEGKVQGCTTSPCGPVTGITAPFTITTPGIYCVCGDQSYAGGAVPAIHIVSSNVELNLDLRTLNLAGTDVGIFVDGTTTPISNIRVVGSGVIDNASTAGIQINAAENVRIDGVLINSCGAGIQIIDSHAVTIDHADLNGGGIGLETTAPDVQHESSSVKILNSSVRNNSTEGISINYLTDDLEIAHCTIENNSGAGILLQAATELTQVMIHQTFLLSNTLGLDCQSGIQNLLVQDVLIDDSSSDGIFFESAANTTLENCQILNSGGRGIHIDFGIRNLLINSCEVLNSAQSPFEAVSLSDSVIENSTFGTTAENQISAMLFSRSDSCIIRNCELFGLLTDPTAPINPSISLITGTNGLTLQNCHGFLVESCTVTSNALSNNGIGGAAILLYDGNQDCIIRDCSIYNDPTAAADIGIAIDNANGGITVEACTIQGAHLHGLLIDGLEKSLIQNNTISSTSDGTGLTVQNGKQLHILSNTIMSNLQYGLHLTGQAKNCTVRDNTVYANGKVGIVAHQKERGNSNTIYHNFSYANGKKNYRGVDFVVRPKRHVGVLENISN